MRKTLLVALLVAAAACGAPRKLRDAQDAFNRAAALENQARLAPDAPGSADAYGVQQSYGAALAALRSIGSEEEAALKADGLWAQKLTLEALCLWKLKEHAEAIEVAEGARGQADAVEDPRDRALLLALPGLIVNDQAYARIPRTPFTGADRAERFREIRDDLTDPASGAISYLEQARRAAKGHPVDAYLVQCGLAVYKNLADAYGNLTVEGFTDQENDAAAALLNDYAAALPPEPPAHPLFKKWLDQFPALAYDDAEKKVKRR